MKEVLTNMKMFVITIAVFVITLGFCVYVYYSAAAPLDLKVYKKAIDIEITLPVLEWTKYTSLSKNVGQVLGVKTSRRRNPASYKDLVDPVSGPTQVIIIK